MKHPNTENSGVMLHQILTVFDDIRRNSLKQASSPLQKKLYGLTLRQGSALGKIMLLTRENPAGVALKTLAQHMQMAVSATSILVESMVSKNLVERAQNPSDRRAVLIRLSEKGEQVFRETNEIVLKEMVRLSSALTPGELASLHSIALKLNSFTFDTPTTNK